MLDHLDKLLRRLFLSPVTGLTDEAQVGFQPPDQVWRSHVANLQQNALNVYLVDLRENRKLRSNERLREVSNGVARDEPAPARVDCHYLITAWSPAVVTPEVESAEDEHLLLYQATAVLMGHRPLVPREVYAPAMLPPGFPKLIADAELPVTVLPAEGFPKYAEFWGTMGQVHPWKPAVYLVVTLPVALPREDAGRIVTTKVTEYRQDGRPEDAEVGIQVGGHVLDALNPLPSGLPAPVAGAWVRLETPTGEPLRSTKTDDSGRFSFDQLRPGRYLLRWRADGHPVPAPRLVDVPSPTGEYDLRFA